MPSSFSLYMKILKLLINLIFPPKCIFCKEIISPYSYHRVCEKCANSLPYCKAYVRCSRCGMPIGGEKNRLCRDCLTKRRYSTRITSAFLYKDEVKNAIMALKHELSASVADELSLYVAGMVKDDFGGEVFDFVISVPPRKKSRNEERFDQAAYLASKVARRLGVPYLKAAMKQKIKVKRQSSLKHDERLVNLKNVFEVVKADKLKGKTVLLIDDVTTTGTTLDECAKELKKCGVHRVYGATVAKTCKTEK